MVTENLDLLKEEAAKEKAMEVLKCFSKESVAEIRGTPTWRNAFFPAGLSIYDSRAN